SVFKGYERTAKVSRSSRRRCNSGQTGSNTTLRVLTGQRELAARRIEDDVDRGGVVEQVLTVEVGLSDKVRHLGRQRGIVGVVLRALFRAEVTVGEFDQYFAGFAERVGNAFQSFLGDGQQTFGSRQTFADSFKAFDVAAQTDRKSTRLNSSHVKISYA